MEGCCFIFSFWYWPIFCETKIALIISWEKEVNGLKIAKFEGKENKWNVPFISSTGEDLNKPGRPGGGGVVAYQYTRKKFDKIPKIKVGILYTWNSKKVIYRIPVFKLQYTVYPI